MTHAWLGVQWCTGSVKCSRSW